MPVLTTSSITDSVAASTSASAAASASVTASATIRLSVGAVSSADVGTGSESAAGSGAGFFFSMCLGFCGLTFFTPRWRLNDFVAADLPLFFWARASA